MEWDFYKRIDDFMNWRKVESDEKVIKLFGWQIFFQGK